jgi:hypothetical protein
MIHRLLACAGCTAAALLLLILLLLAVMITHEALHL